jgi:hypothetical protein
VDFDDIHWSPAMEELGNDKHPKVTVTIDTFQWGCFLYEQQKNIL